MINYPYFCVSKIYFDAQMNCEHNLDKYNEYSENKKVRLAAQEKQDEIRVSNP